MNKHWHRKGSVFGDRYFVRVLERRMSQIRKVLRYVLQNARKHGVQQIPAGEADPYSSARWFKWHQQDRMKRPLRSPPVALSGCMTTDVCLLHGLDINDLPGRRDWGLGVVF